MIAGERRKLEKRIFYLIIRSVIFIGIIAIPCFLIMHYANRLITKKIRANNENFLYTTSVSLDSELSGAYAKAESLVEQNAADYHVLLNTNEAASADQTVALYHFYNAFKESSLDNNFFDHTFFYFPESKLVVASQGTYDEDVYFKKTMIFGEYSSDYFSQLAQTSFSSVFCPATQILTQDLSGNVSVSQTSVIPVAVKPIETSAGNGIVILLIDEEKLTSFFDRLSIDRSSFIYLQNTETGEILNSPSDVKYEELLQLSAQNYKAKNQQLEMRTKEGDNCQVFWKNSSVSRLRYICVEPELLITRQIRSFTYWTFLITAAAVAVLSAIVGSYSKYMNRNIGAMIGRLSEASGVTADVQGKQLVNLPQLKEAVEVLCAQHENSRPYLVDSFLERTFRDTMTPEERVNFKKEFPEFEDGKFFQIYLWKLQDMEKQKVAALRKRLETYGYVLFVQSESAFLVYLTAKSSDRIEKKQGQIEYDESNQGQERSYICAKSTVFSSINENYRNYHQVLNIINYYGAAQEKLVYTMDDLLGASEEMLTQEEKSQIKILLKKNSSEACEYVRRMIEQMKKNNISMYQLRVNIKELVFVLQEALYEQQIPISTVFAKENESKELDDRLDAALTPERLERLCLDLYRRVPDFGSQKDVVSQAEQTLLTFIDENLSEISLDMLSEAVGMNPNYLSQYFKKHFGIGFIDYVTNKKMEKAKELLITTDYTCKAIGELLGYGAQNTFIRVFKKAESMTPAEYRQKKKKE